MRRMVPYNEWVKLKEDVAEIEEEIGGLTSSTNAYVFQRNIPANRWSNGSCSLQLNIGSGKTIGLNDAIIVSISEVATEAQYNAVRDADISVIYTGNNYVRLTANGDVPEISIPINFTVLTPSIIGI